MLGGIANLKEIGAALTLAAHSAGLKTGVDMTLLAGGDFDRLPDGGGDASPQQFESLVFEIAVFGDLSAGEDLSLTIDVEHADLNAAGTGPGTYAAAPTLSQPADPAIIDGGAGGPYAAVLRFDLRITELKRFLRFNITPLFSLANVSETANLQGIICAGGAHNLVTRVPDYIPNYAA